MELISRMMVAFGKVIIKIGKSLRKQDNEWKRTLKRWKVENNEHLFRYNYPMLNKSSLVFDLGGFEGQWASDMYGRFGCKINIFEPNPMFCERIKLRFQSNDDVEVFCFGLGPKDEEIKLGIDSDSTSSYKPGSQTVSAELKSVNDYFQDYDIKRIDLMKINIEGGEYDLLEEMTRSGLITRIDQIQVQFHHFIPNAERRMVQIQKTLEKTHSLTYQFPFLWENWERLPHS